MFAKEKFIKIKNRFFNPEMVMSITTNEENRTISVQQRLFDPVVIEDAVEDDIRLISFPSDEDSDILDQKQLENKVRDILQD